MQATDCAAACGNPPPTPVNDATPCLLYFLDYSQKPPQVNEILVCHSSDVACRPNLHLALSTVFQGAMRKSITLGFAEAITDIKVILDFLEKFYGKPSSWTSIAAEANLILREQRKLRLYNSQYAPPSNPSPQATPPSPQALLQTLNTLLNIPPGDFNPALLPINSPGYVEVNIGRHQPPRYTRQTVLTTLEYDKYEIPESTAHGIVQYGQEFIEAVIKISAFTNGNANWSKKHPNSSWFPEQISDFLYDTLQANKTAKVSTLLGQLSNIRNSRNRIIFAGNRTTITNLDIDDLKTYLTAQILMDKQPDGKTTIVCLCGSSKQKADFEAAEYREELAGKIVLTLNIYSQSTGIVINDPHLRLITALHYQKIDMAHEVLIILKPDDTGKALFDDRMGKSTLQGRDYAVQQGKIVNYFDPQKDS